MQIHYFQRYHQKENVATANTMLLLSRLYHESSEKFFLFLKSEFFADSQAFQPEPSFRLQVNNRRKNGGSVPDASIMQEGFQLVVETKLWDWFYSEQLENHLNTFGEEKYKVLITLAPEYMEEKKKAEFEERLRDYNSHQKYPVLHVNTTFERLAEVISETIDDRDYEMREILDDYLDFCYTDGLITVSNAWKYLRMQLAGTTLDYNIEKNVYYDDAERGFRAHDYLGLYKKKSVRAIGKITAMITAVMTENGLDCVAEKGELTEERKQTILNAMEDGTAFSYDLKSYRHRYFFVERFYPCDFQKISPYAAMGTRIFDLTQVLQTDILPDTEELARELSKKTWQ